MVRPVIAGDLAPGFWDGVVQQLSKPQIRASGAGRCQQRQWALAADSDCTSKQRQRQQTAAAAVSATATATQIKTSIMPVG